MSEEVLEVKPFQDVFYYSCLDNPIISLIYSVRGDIIPVLQNDVFYYKEQEFLLVGRKSKRDLFMLLKEEGFHTQTVDEVTDLMSLIKEQQAEGKYIFIPVDAYYMSDMKEYYKKRHHNNYMLVLNENNGILTYINSIGAKTAVRKCHNKEMLSGFYSKYNDRKKFMIICYREMEHNVLGLNERESFLCNYRENQTSIIDGISRVEAFLHSMKEKLETPQIFREYYSNNRYFFETVLSFDIVNRIEAQYYQHRILFQDYPAIVNIRKLIWEEWRDISEIFHKYNFDPFYVKSSLLRVLESVQKICILEKEYILMMEWNHM